MMDTLEAYKLNFQSIYLTQHNAVSWAVNLLEFGKRQFESTYKFQKIDALKEISNTISNNKEPNHNLLEEFTISNLIDNIKISICFENFFKGVLLSELYLVHELNENKFSKLSKHQKERPILVSELLKIAPWRFYKINGSDGIKYDFGRIDGIKNKTIAYSSFLNKKIYIDYFNVEESLLNILRKINIERNKLHLNVSQSASFNSNSYSEFKLLVDFIKNKLESILNSMCDFLELDKNNRQFKMIIKKNPIK